MVSCLPARFTDKESEVEGLVQGCGARLGQTQESSPGLSDSKSQVFPWKGSLSILKLQQWEEIAAISPKQRASLVAQLVKNPPATQETLVHFHFPQSGGAEVWAVTSAPFSTGLSWAHRSLLPRRWLGPPGPPPPGQPAASGRLMWGYNKGALLSLGETDSEAISTPGLRAQVGSG